MPRPIGGRRFPAQDVEIAVVRAYLEKDILRAVPLVYHLFDHVLTILKSKTNRSFVRRSTGVAIHIQLHFLFSFLSPASLKIHARLIPRLRSEPADRTS
jgi:hypothetical protein